MRPRMNCIPQILNDTEMKIYRVLGVLVEKRGEPWPIDRKTVDQNMKILSIITKQRFSTFLRLFLEINSIFDLLQFGLSIIITIFKCSFSLLLDGFILTGTIFEVFKISIWCYSIIEKKSHFSIFCQLRRKTFYFTLLYFYFILPTNGKNILLRKKTLN